MTTIDQVEKATDEARAALQTAEAKMADALQAARDAQDQAEIHAMEAQVAEEAAEDQVERMVATVVETVRRVHEDARHPGLVQVCRVRSCEIWTDLLRDQGWRA